MVRLFVGGIRPLPPDNRATGIFKTEVHSAVLVGRNGLAGDVQADRRVHGGPEKAVHQYPIGNYALLAEAFPEVRNLLIAGSLGENLSVDGWDEANVCIGDIFRLGEAVIQVSQPRTPCWKIDSRFGVEGMTRFIDQSGLSGWYYRVIEEGMVAPESEFTLIERGAHEVSVDRLLSTWREHRPVPEVLESIASIPALSANWVKKLSDRAERLKQLS
jgi:MOSC domain-containing protein YiiM